MSRIFPYDEWAPSPSQASADSFATPFTYDGSKKSMSLPFRKRLQSLPLVGKDLEILRSPNMSETGSGSGSDLAQDDGKRLGGIVGLFRKASVSIKNRQRRHSHAVPMEERPQTESPWRRLKTATSFHRHSKFLSVNDTDGLFDSYEEDMHVPIPGNGREPPRIPRNHGGAAARATAARQNELIEFTERNRQRLSPPDSMEDQESGIGITVSMADQVVTTNFTTNTATRVDFITSLPTELAILILARLDLKTLYNVLFVSKGWSGIVNSTPIWQEAFLRDQTQSYATGKPIPLGAGVGLPDTSSPATNWKDLYRIRQQLNKNWKNGTNDAYYLHGHLDSIYCVQFDEEKIITGSRDKTIRVWDLRSRTCVLIIGPPGVVESPSILFDDKGNALHYTTNYNSENQDQSVVGQQSFPKTASFAMHHEQSILCLQYDKEILVTGSSDSTCIVYNMKDNYKPIRRLQHHTAAVLDLAFDDKYIVTCSKDAHICVWDRHTGDMVKKLEGHSGPVNAVQLRGNTIVSCSGDFKVMMWSIDDKRMIAELTGHTKGLACSQFSEDSKWIASAGNDKNICIWDANTHARVYEIPKAHQSLVRSLHIDSISGRLISGSYDGGLKVFDMASGLETINFPQWHASWVLGAKSDYRHIISTGQEPKILIMDFGRGIEGIDKLRSTGTNP